MRNDSDEVQTFIVRLDPGVARRMRGFLSSRSGRGYASISEFVEVAVLNQLLAEDVQQARKYEEQGSLMFPDEAVSVGAPPHRGFGVKQPIAPDPLLTRPEPTPPADLLVEMELPDETLSPLTNRLSPMKMALRVAVHLATGGLWPDLSEFHRRAATSARQLGLMLRQGSEVQRRRAVGYPTGTDAEKSASRYVASFTLSERNGRVTGPLAVLGFATIADGRVVLTRNGWRLAAAPSPLVEGRAESTVSQAEAKVLREAIASAPAECLSVKDFLGAVLNSGGSQAGIDSYIASSRPPWSREMIVAHRAAMLGRLAEAEAVEVVGRGPGAIVRLLPAASELMQESGYSSDSANNSHKREETR